MTKWNTSQADRRTSNSMEGLNSRMTKDLNAARKNVWTYFSVLQKENLFQEVKLAQHSAPGLTVPHGTDQLRKREHQISRFTVLMENNALTPVEFVNSVASLLPYYN